MISHFQIKSISRQSNGTSPFSGEPFIEQCNDRDIEMRFNQKKKDGCQVIICVIQDNQYAKIKQIAEIRCGVLTQCFRSSTLRNKIERQDMSTVSNLLLKLNAKLNGVNHHINNAAILNKNKCMVIGADVTHPSPDQSSIPRYLT